MKNRKIKSEMGAISVFVMVAMLFFLVTVVGAYAISSRRAQTQTESLDVVQDKYYTEGEEDTKYDSRIMSSYAKIPIYTKEQFWSIGEDQAIEIDGKVYDFSSTDYANYELKNDIVINIETDLKNSKFKDNVFYNETITKNGHQILYYYQGKYYVPVTYSDGTNTHSLATGTAVLSASGTDFAAINTTTTGLDGEYYLFGITIPPGLDEGDTVTYSPSGTYNWAAEYASSDLANDGSADVALATGTKVTSSNQDMSITSWKVFSIDENTGKIELVPSAPSSGGVRLQGAQGYNNAVYLLNDACNSLYGNGSTITARSISMEDIEGAMTETALAEAHSYNNGNATWGTQITSAYTGSKNYPTIYAKENLSVINGVKNTAGLGMSEQNTLIGKSDEGATDGKLTASQSIQPYQTYWKCDNAFMQTAFKENGYSLLIPKGTETIYWVASRCVYSGVSSCGFYIRYIGGGYVDARNVYGSNDGVDNGSRPIFPVVSLTAENISGNDATGWKVE